MEIQRGLYQSGSNSSLYAGVPQHAYGITSGISSRPILFTCDILSCLVVTIYDREKKVGALLHIDYEVSDSIQKIFEKFKNQGVQLNQLEVQIMGGCPAGSSGQFIKNIHDSSKAEIMKTTTNIVDMTCEKNMDGEEERKVLFTLGDKFRNAPQGNCKLLKREFDEKLKKYRYTQIALDTFTGEILTSSDQRHLIARPWDDAAYSKTAQVWVEKIITARQLESSPKILEILRSPLEKVYDGTQTKDRV